MADQAAIRRLGETSTNSHFQDELRDLRYVTQRDGGFLRRRLGIRVSFAKLERLRARVARATGN